MWVFEETVTLPKDSKHYDASTKLSTEPQKLTTLINTLHENVKYLPNIPLPPNLIANPSLIDAVRDSTILIFNLPHQFISNLCSQMKGHILPYARGVSCIKGVHVSASTVSLFSEMIGSELGIYCGALSGANIANEVAQEKFSETTIAYDPPPMDHSRTPSRVATPRTATPQRGPSPMSSHVDLTALTPALKSPGLLPSKPRINFRALPPMFPPLDHTTLKTLFQRPYFHVRLVSDVPGVSLSGALKNIVALAAGFVSGLGWGDNAKAAIMRVGLLEMVKFGETFFGDGTGLHTPSTPSFRNGHVEGSEEDQEKLLVAHERRSQGVQAKTFTEESAGVADLITSCSGGRNFRCARMSVERGVPIGVVEKEELNGQMLQGTSTAEEVNSFLKERGMEADFPLFTAVYRKSVAFPCGSWCRFYFGKDFKEVKYANGFICA